MKIDQNKALFQVPFLFCSSIAQWCINEKKHCGYCIKSKIDLLYSTKALNMTVSRQRLRSRQQTGNWMHQLIERFNNDLDHIKDKDGVFLSDYPLRQFYDFVRMLPYKRDISPVEVVARPAFIVEMAGKGGIDCKKKAILLGSYAKRKGIPFRMIAMSSRPDGKIHHVFPQFFVEGAWVNMDATYKRYRIGQQKKVSAYEVL